MAFDFSLLTPKIEGAEAYTIDPVDGAKAFSGTGFNWDNDEHFAGTEEARYAIALQQLRDRGEYGVLDAARSQVESFGFFVMQDRDGTRVKMRPRGYSYASVGLTAILKRG